ncbi:MAG TPA: replicative DNA helicase [Bacteroidales bacterium]|nr:replicative DNA helicase [Bacteroidales bacterium]
MEEQSNPTTDKTRRRVKKSFTDQDVIDHGKLPPQAIELEEAVLGAIMLEKDALAAVIDILKPETFYKEVHQHIFRAIQQLFQKTEPVDILTVTNQLKSNGLLDVVGGPYYITQLTNRISSAANIEYHSRILMQKYIQRELIRTSSEIIRDSFEDTTDVFDLLDKAEQNLFTLSETNLRRSVLDMPSLIKEAVENIEKAKSMEGHLSGVPSGFTALDRVTNGWQASDLIVIAARPGMGKTAFVLTMARNIAVDFKKPVAIFSLEMSAIQLVTRLISAETLLPAEKLKKGNLENHEWHQLNVRIKNLEDAKFLIDDTPALTIFELRAKCRRLKAQHNIELAIVDYLQLMSGGGENKGNREQEISNISRSLKGLAKELNMPIIAISQLSRAVETRGGSKKPILSDLRESGAIEQDADMVIFIYRPEYYKITEDAEGNSTAGLAEICIAKHRNGKNADIPLRFIENYALFKDYDEQFHSESGMYASESHGSNVVTFQSKINEMDDSGDDDQEAPF